VAEGNAVSDINAWNEQLIESFRIEGGRVGGNFEGVPLLILHSIGARTGAARENPLVYLPIDGVFVVFASGGGAPRNPDWYHNLVASPQAAIEVGTDILEVNARVAEGDERDRYWELQKRIIPAFEEHDMKTERKIPVVVLEPVG
jgi:deazaflavin-dependent oxidoreductase (nitroreductase family)